MNKLLFFSLALLLLASCRKRHDNLYGATTISGTVTDRISGQPLPQAEVRLYQVRLKSNPFGKTPLRDEDSWLTAETDNNGYYQFTFEAKGEYAFDLVADPRSRQYVGSELTSPQNKRVEKTGSQTLDLACNRSAWARVSLTNTGARNTSYAMSLSSNADNLVVYNFSRDTTVYLKLVGYNGFTNSIRLTINDEHIDENRTMEAAPWDTASLHFSF